MEQGGEPGTEPDDSSDENFGTLWGWLDGIASALSSVIENIAAIPGLIGEKITAAVASIIEGIGNFFSTLWEWLKKIWDSIVSLPGKIGDVILEGVKAIFIPDTGYVEEAYSNFVNDLKMKFQLDYTAFERLFENETPVEDVDVNYNIPGVGKLDLKFLDTSFLKEGVAYFRPFIRGFLVLMMLLFHVKQLLGFFGYNAGVIQGRSDWISYNNTNTGGHKE